MDPSLPPSEQAVSQTPFRVEAIGLDRLDLIRHMNRMIFDEERIINRFDRPDLLMLVAFEGDRPVGFKVGYGESKKIYYSAKGGVMKDYRRRGVALLLLHEMMARVKASGYRRFAYDTFPNRHPGMLILGLNEGFRVVAADFNPVYRDFRIRLEKDV